jgi:predicted RNase H-like HicB family nuclease
VSLGPAQDAGYDGTVDRMKLTAIHMKVPEGYIAFTEELPGANSRGATLEEARANLAEAVQMVLEANRDLAEESISGASIRLAARGETGCFHAATKIA